MHGIAKPELFVMQDFAAKGIQGDILRRRKEGQRDREPDHRRQIGRRREAAKQTDRQEQANLRNQRPAPSATERQAIAIEQRRPEKFPGIGELDQGEETDDLEVDAVEMCIRDRSTMPDVNSEFSTASKQKLVSDMKIVVSDAEEILRATAGVAGEKMGDLRERIGESLRDAKLRLADAEVAVVDRTKAAARATDDFCLLYTSRCV